MSSNDARIVCARAYSSVAQFVHVDKWPNSSMKAWNGAIVTRSMGSTGATGNMREARDADSGGLIGTCRHLSQITHGSKTSSNENTHDRLYCAARKMHEARDAALHHIL